MTILSPHDASRIRNRAMGILHLIAADERCEVPYILALIAPSQPSPASQAPAARMSDPAPADVPAGEARPASPATQSNPSAQGINEPLVTVANGANEGGDDEVARTENARTKHDGRADERGQRTDAGPVGSDVGTVQTGKSAEPSGSAATSRADQLRALFADGKQPTAKEATIALGYTGHGPANRLAAKLGLTFRKVSKEELRANGLAARAKQVAQQRAAQSATTEALKEAVAKPQEPVERAGPPTPRSETLPPPAKRAEPVAPRKVATRAPTGRFYLRDKVTGHFVHQSLQQAPNGNGGPLMTSDRKWAWFDTIERYRGAKKRWPQLADMRKEAVQA